LVSDGDVIKEGVMLPDELRNSEEDLSFLKKWMHVLPKEVLYEAKPFHLEKG